MHSGNVSEAGGCSSRGSPNVKCLAFDGNAGGRMLCLSLGRCPLNLDKGDKGMSICPAHSLQYPFAVCNAWKPPWSMFVGHFGIALLASTLDGHHRDLWRLHSAKARRCSSRSQACRLVRLQTPFKACQVHHRYCTTSDAPKARASVCTPEHRASSCSLTNAVPGT